MNREEEISPNGSRAAILGRIAEALRETAPRHYHALQGSAPADATAPFRQWLPPVGETRKEQTALFAQQSEVLRTEFRECASIAAAAKHLGEMAVALGWKKVAMHSGTLTSDLAARLGEVVATHCIDTGYDKDALEACDAGLTECETLVAQTGSVCVTAKSSGGRALSVLPPHHVVIARSIQLVPDLSAAYAALAEKYRGAYPSFVSFITGPSRTGDIERILVLGAHGPKKLTVLLVP